MHIFFQLKLMTQEDRVWIFEWGLYIVDFTNVYCAYNFVCLLVELHINACITHQVIKSCDNDEDQTLSSEQHQKHVFFLLYSISLRLSDCYQVAQNQEQKRTCVIEDECMVNAMQIQY